VLGTEGKDAVLVCAACRDGAQPMIDQWAMGFDDALCSWPISKMSVKNPGLKITLSFWDFILAKRHSDYANV
jgi:hypothetical protein